MIQVGRSKNLNQFEPMTNSNARSDAFWRRVFQSTAVFNVAIAASLLVVPSHFFVDIGFRPVPVPSVYVHGFALAVALFGLAYYWVSRDLSERSLVQLGLLSKLAVFAIMLGHVWLGDASWHSMALGCIDLVYVVLFDVFLRRTPAVRDDPLPA